MAYNNTITVSDETKATLLSQGGAITGDLDLEVLGPLYIVATNGQVRPTTKAGAQLWTPGNAQIGVTLAKLFAGVTGANHLWAWPAAGIPADAVLSYA